ncbi:cytochrome c3 family protein [Noviherbaspirillum sp. UKPF54]|uniref:cytochrome c3 family protein n=1 Tax=Noviherbaspirillum sp. UKPF54 TaxID=2601898 RepID=UPI001AF00233|nr:cytochrome c3 family protein [Noviherbaspirillum sp. UKPF54]
MTGVMAMLLIGAGFIASDASAGISNTKHNLSGSMTVAGRVNSFAPDAATTTGNGEICVFCHTPHGSDTGAAVPLWNRSLGAKGGATYKTYNSLGTSSLDGATAPVGSVSLACLSCHDGTQAMNVMINQPGSGGYNSGGQAWAGTWTGANQTGGTLAVSGQITYIGTDLTNDHPIGIQYAGGPKGTTTIPTTSGKGVYTSTMFRDADFQPANAQALNSMTVWWVDTERDANGAINPNGTREKTDMQLYTRTETGTGYTSAQPFVECASCHDPHTENVTFLRMTDGNKNSQICLSCHIK